MNDTRIKWIDILKGIGIILVVVGHANWLFTNATPSTFIQKYIYSFHMPLFFFLSGYLFINKKYSNYKKILILKFKTLLIPYFFFSIIPVLYNIMVTLKYNGNLFNYQTIIIQVLYLKKTIVVWDEPLWFLVCLFVVEILYYSISGYKWNTKIIILLFCAYGGYRLSSVANFYVLPWSIGIALTSIIFYAMGNYFRHSKIGHKITLPNRLIFCIFFTINLIIGGFQNIYVSMYYLVYGNLFYFYLASFSGIIAYIQISQFIKKNNFLTSIFEYYGRNSIIILCTHYFVLKFLQNMHITDSLFLNYTPLKGYLNALITLLLSIPSIFIINRFFPCIFGRKKMSINIANKMLVIPHE